MTKKEKLIADTKNNWKMRFFMLKRLPMAFIAGLKVINIDDEKASVSIPFKFLNQNPFQSIYFAALAMAAELSTGIIAMVSVQTASIPVSMLVLNMSANFSKKAKGLIVFTCNEAKAIEKAIAESIESGEGKTVTVTSRGVDQAGDEVAEFKFTWTFKPKSK